MKLVTICCCLGLLIPSYIKGQNTEEHPKVRIVLQYVEAGFQQDYETQGSLMAPGIIDYHPTLLSTPAKGKDQLIEGWKSTHAPIDSIQFDRWGAGVITMGEGLIQGEWAYLAGVVRSRFMGKTDWVSYHFTGLYKVENGLIEEVRNFGNLLDIYLQLGYSLEPPK